MIAFMLFAGIKIMAGDELITEQVAITLDEPGTLGNKIGFKKKNLITNLKIEGGLNIDDMKYIREMAGCYYSENAHYNGNLAHLDLEEAWFIDSGDKCIKSYSKDGGSGADMYLSEPCVSKRQFFALTSLRSIVLPKYITSIEDDGFEYCENLISVTIPTTLTKIGQWAFNGCAKLYSVNLPESLTHIDLGAFANCSSLQSINLPKNLIYIDQYAFVGCIKLSSVNLPESLTGIGDDVFSGCI